MSELKQGCFALTSAIDAGDEPGNDEVMDGFAEAARSANVQGGDESRGGDLTLVG